MNIYTSAYILAGGQSKRFGQDKSLYSLEDRPLIQHVFDIITPLFPKIYIIANDPDKFNFLPVKVYPDLISGLGPAGGIYTALDHLKEDRAFIFACDLPYLNDGFIEYMLSIASSKEIIVPFVANFFEPLHAIYSKECLKSLKTFIDQKERKMTNYLKRSDVRKVGEDEITFYENPFKIFKNINQQTDL